MIQSLISRRKDRCSPLSARECFFNESLRHEKNTTYLRKSIANLDRVCPNKVTVHRPDPLLTLLRD